MATAYILWEEPAVSEQTTFGQNRTARGEMELDLLVSHACFASGLASTIDVLNTANIVWQHGTGREPPFHWRVLSSDGASVMSSGGLRLGVDGSWSDANAPFRIAFGVGMADVEIIESALESDEGRYLVQCLGRGHQDGATLMASCSSTFFLAQTGCLDGGIATTSWWLSPVFRRRFPRIRLEAEHLVCVYDRVWSAGAAMAQFDLVLSFVRHKLGPEIAHAVARYLVIDDQRTSQSPYTLVEHLQTQDELIEQARTWLQQHIQEGLRIHALAAHLAVSPRTLHRRFTRALGMPPKQYAQRLRAQMAMHLLITTDWSVSRVAGAVGYAEDGSLRRALRQHLKTNPRQVRQGLAASLHHGHSGNMPPKPT